MGYYDKLSLEDQKLVRKVLLRAREYVANPDTWTRGMDACNSDNFSVDISDPSACKFCAGGAITISELHEFGGESQWWNSKSRRSFNDFVVEERRKLGLCNGFIVVNDEEGREAVLAYFDKWIAEHPV